MLVISIIITLMDIFIILLLIKKTRALTNDNYVIGELVHVDAASDSSVKLFEATYRYMLNNTPKLYTSDKRKKNPKYFEKEIKIYYKENSSNLHVFEKPSEEILGISIILVVLCLASVFIYSAY